MSRLLFRTSLLAALAAAQAHAAPSDPKCWSKVEVDPGTKYILTNDDKVAPIGTLWCRKKGDTGIPGKVGERGAAYTLESGDYEFYFDTTLKGIAMHLRFQNVATGQSFHIHVTNADPTVKGTEIQVSGKPLSSVPVVIDPSGYRNKDGGTLFKLKAGASK